MTPPPVCRGERLLARVDNGLARADAALARILPAGTDVFAETGRLANLSLLVAVVSGVGMLFWYSSSLSQAHASLAALEPGSPGAWVRALHRYSSDAVMAFLLMHAGRMFFARKFAGARWLAWVSGVGLTGLIWFIGWLGYWLVWDQPAQKIATESMRFLDALPIFGEPLGRLFLTDRLVPSLLFFVVFFLHMLLPLMIAVALVVHLVRLNRVKLLPSRGVALAFLLPLGIVAWCLPAPLDSPAAMAEKAARLTVDTWYLAPLAMALRFQGGGLWLALGGGLALAAGVPWLLGRRFAARAVEGERRPPAAFQTVVEVSRCHACTQCVQDCPFDAVHMVPRTDGKRFATQAWVDPTRCVGCAVCVGSCDSEAMHLPWFDAVVVEPQIQAAARAAMGGGAPVRLALVAADACGNMTLFDEAVWRARLPDYLVRVVPTASWVRPKFVERLLASGVERVLVIRDARAEAAARDGNRWIQDRLSGARHPKFRPERLGTASGRWMVVENDAANPAALARTAAAFARQDEQTIDRATGPAAPGGWGRRLALSGLFAATLLAIVGLSRLQVANPESPDPEFVLSFKAFGPRKETQVSARSGVSDAAVPIHMRGAPVAKPQRRPVRVRVTIDGVRQERDFAAKGISSDGPAIAVWRKPLTPGLHQVEVEISSESVSWVRWSGAIEAKSRRLHVLSYDPSEGFRVE